MPIRFGSVSRNHWSRYPPLTVGRAGYGRVATGFGATAVTPCLLRVQRPRRTVIRGDRSPFSVGQNAWAGTPGLPRFEICRSPVPPAALPEVTATWFQVCDGAAGRPPRRGRDHARAALDRSPSWSAATTRAITGRSPFGTRRSCRAEPPRPDAPTARRRTPPPRSGPRSRPPLRRAGSG